MPYAESTTVSAHNSRAEIEKILQRYGADSFMYGWETDRAMVQFRANERIIRFIVDMPDRDDPEFTNTPTGRMRSIAQTEKAWEQGTRQRWRALALVIKAKLEAVDAGITEFESEFLAHILLPDGTSVGDWVLPAVAEAYESGDMPKALPMPS